METKHTPTVDRVCEQIAASERNRLRTYINVRVFGLLVARIIR